MLRLLLATVLVLGGGIVGREIWAGFFNLPSLLITVGGTLCVTLLTFSWARLRELGSILRELCARRQQSPQKQIAELRRLAHLYHLQGLKGLEKQEGSIADPFLEQGIRMLVDLQREECIQENLEKEFIHFVSRYEAARQILLTVGKLLPAFGLIGTLIGLVLLLHQLPHLDLHALPSALSIAVLTTLYGTLLANLVVFPLATKLHSFAYEREALMRLTLEGVLSLARGEHPATIERRLRTLLPIAWQEQRNQAGQSGSHRSLFALQRSSLREATR
ncbi:MAG: MotA/TolQ/ExbB proton channel family protein [Candidatus Binatia bacterium]|nr:MotA/TolQ/ExbB proton channel family protein [Candidatus Binatia bacterium]